MRLCVWCRFQVCVGVLVSLFGLRVLCCNVHSVFDVVCLMHVALFAFCFYVFRICFETCVSSTSRLCRLLGVCVC